MTVTLEQARQALPKSHEITSDELEEVLAFFYFLGEQAFERLRQEKFDE